MKILVTGGLGFIGSHTAVELLNQNYDVILVDNLYNSKLEVYENIKTITKKVPIFYQGDVCDPDFLEMIFERHKMDAIIHFAGYKAVGESVKKPLEYYENNLVSTINLCKMMKKYGCKNLVFSSSATVYGSPKELPIKEDFPLQTTNPYGTTKLVNEWILKDFHHSDPSFGIILLRYFNPIGAHESGLLGEDPNGIPNNLMPYILKVADGSLPKLNIFGNDYPTRDGTGVRDYIHVVDLAKGHLKAIEKILKEPIFDVYNLGTGKGYSVLEVVKAFEEANQIKIPYEIKERREGDVAECYADVSHAFEDLHFQAEKDLKQMCQDAYRYNQRKKERK